jgi:ABC-type nickel/cobalt efflux system permease component RcnA
MLTKIIAHTLLLPYNTLCILTSFSVAVVGGAARVQTIELAEAIEKSRKSLGLFVFTQLVVVASTIYSQKGLAILGGISFLVVSSIGKYLLWKSGNSAFQPGSASDYQYQSNNLYEQQHLELQNQSNNPYWQQQLEQHQLELQRRYDDEHYQREQEDYERQQRESQQRHEEQMRRDEEFRQRQREEEQRRDEENRRNWGRLN